MGKDKAMYVHKLEKYAFQVLTMVEEGCSYRQIAKQFHLSKNTVMDIVEQFKGMHMN